MLLTFSIKPTINFDNNYYAQKISDALDTYIESDELIESLTIKNGKTFFIRIYTVKQFKSFTLKMEYLVITAK